jgi:hypothetical protein
MPGDFTYPVFPNYPNVGEQSVAANFQQPGQSGAHYPFSPQTSPTSASPGEANASKIDAIHDQNGQVVIEESARLAAEEDKRRRNTAASARFRIKKKQREQALERTAKEMTEKVQVLESKVSQLEMENKWLKSLITEKNENKGDVTNLYRKLTEKKNEGERSTGERNDGVGTSGEDVKSKV